MEKRGEAEFKKKKIQHRIMIINKLKIKNKVLFPIFKKKKNAKNFTPFFANFTKREKRDGFASQAN